MGWPQHHKFQQQQMQSYAVMQTRCRIAGRQLWEAGTRCPGGECVEPCANHIPSCICKSVARRLRGLSPSVHHMWDHIWSAPSSLGLPSTRKPRKYWREPSGGPKCSGEWTTWDTRKGQENLVCSILKRLAKGTWWLSSAINFIIQYQSGDKNSFLIQLIL